jgi:hypothetical protein
MDVRESLSHTKCDCKYCLVFFHSKVQKKNPLPAVTIRADLGHHIAAGIDNARLSCSLQFGVEESSFSGSKVAFEAAWFDLLIDAVESLTERGWGLEGRGRKYRQAWGAGVVHGCG